MHFETLSKKREAVGADRMAAYTFAWNSFILKDSVFDHLKEYGRLPDTILERMFDKKQVTEADYEQLKAEQEASAEAHKATMTDLNA